MIDAIELWRPRILYEAKETIAYAEAAGISAPWLDRLRSRAAVLSRSKRSRG